MKKYLAIAAAASAIAVATPALAQDNAEATFTGPRVEVLMGYDKTKAGSSIDDLYDRNNSSDGLLYGIGVGYDVDLGGVALGAEAELSDSTAKTRFHQGELENFGYGRVKAGRDIYVGARVGAKVAPSTLLYVKGGYTNAQLKADANYDDIDYGTKFKLDGWRVGAGVEQAIGQSAFAKIEYRYSKYEKAKFDFGDGGPDSHKFDVDTDRHQIVVGAGVRF